MKSENGKNINRYMALNQWFPSKLIVGSHLFRRKLDKMGEEYFNVSNVDDPKNGLLLFKPIKVAFDKFQISIIKVEDDFVLKIIDPNIKNLALVDLLDNDQMEKLIGLSKTKSDASNLSLINRLHKEKFGSEIKKRKRENEIKKTFDFRTTFGDLDGKK